VNLTHPKVMDPERLKVWLAGRGGRTVGFTNGCFDIHHPGHVDYLARARGLGDILVLALNTDESVRRLGKAPDRPVNPLEVRAFVAAHLESVSAVTWFDEDTPARIIEFLRPDVLVKGGDWPVERIVGRETVEGYGGKVRSLPFLQGYSTTGLLGRIRKS